MKSKFNRNEINPQLPGIITLSHGPLAISIVESAELIYGSPIENIAAFSLEENDDPMEYRDAFLEAVNAFPENTIIFMDIFGGTPCNQLIMHAKREGIHVLAIAGMNLPMILNATFLRNAHEDGDEFLKNLFAEAQESIINITDKIEGQ